MRIGRLRHRVTIQQYTTTDNEYGEPVPTWADVATVWASVEPLSGNERMIAQQRNASLTHKVVIRYLAGVTAEMRVKFGDRYFAIVEPPMNIDERDREMHLMCVEGLQDGA